jgi:hypothetical protein
MEKGPSNLIRRDGIETLKSQGKETHFNTERKQFRALNERHKVVQEKIHNFLGKQDEHGEVFA